MVVASINSDYHQVTINPFGLSPAANDCGGGDGKGGSFKGSFISAAVSEFPVSYDDHDHIEMVTFQGSPYTSLRDLLETSPPGSASPSSWLIVSPNHLKDGTRKDSWREIPIKDPLLQHAAWAYLLPMSGADAEGGSHSRNFLQKLKNLLCGGGGLFGCLNDVVRVMTKNWFPVLSR